MNTNTYWKAEALQLVRSVKARQGLSWNDVSKRMKKHCNIDIDGKSLSTKIGQGTFSFVFALQLLSAIGIKKLEIPSPYIADMGNKKE